MAREFVLLWYVTSLLSSEIGSSPGAYNLMVLLHRLSGLGIPDQPPPPAAPTSKIFWSLHLDLGNDPQLFRRCQ